MAGLPVGNAAELMQYLMAKKPGDQITDAELSRLPSLSDTAKGQRKQLVTYLVGVGSVKHKPTGNYFTGNLSVFGVEYQPRRQETPQASDPVAYTTIYRNKGVRQSGLQQDVNPRVQRLAEGAYKFFDPHPSIFRGVVVSELGYDPETDKRRSAAVEVLSPDGAIKFGLVSVPHKDDFASLLYRRRPDFRERTVSLIAAGMKTDQHVLVRHTGEFVGKSGKPTWLFEPLFYITEGDNATLNGERIATSVDGNRIMFLPIVEQGKERLGVSSGVGYIGAGLQSVYIDGVEDRLWEILAEVKVKLVVGKNSSRVFYVGEMPMTADEKTKRELIRIDRALESLRQQTDSMNLFEALQGGEDKPGAEKVYVMTVGALRPAREAGRELEVLNRRDEVRGLISKISAIYNLSKREREIINGVYAVNSEAYQQLTKEWPALVESYIDALKRREYFTLWGENAIEAQNKKERTRKELSTIPPSSYLLPELGFFDQRAIQEFRRREGLQDYLKAVDTAFGIGSRRIEAAHDWRGRFSMQDIGSTGERIIDEEAFWYIIGESFRGVDIQQTWETMLLHLEQSWILNKESLPLQRRFMQPYIELVKQRVS